MRFRFRFWVVLGGFIFLGGAMFATSGTQVVKAFQQPVFETAFSGAFVGHCFPEKEWLTYISTCIVPIFLFEVLFGTYIYSDVERCGVYIFTRQTNRVVWYLGKTVKLLGLSVIYYTAFSLTGVVVLLLWGVTPANITDAVVLVLCATVSYALFGFVVAMAVNILAALFNSGYAFSIINILLVGLLALVVIQDVSIELSDYTFGGAFFWNPVANLVPSWHTFSRPTLDVTARELLAIDYFPYKITFMFFGGLTLVVALVGAPVYKRMQFLSFTKENE